MSTLSDTYLSKLHTALTDLRLPPALRTIGPWAFFRCSHLKTVSLPVTTASVGDYAFAWCQSLARVGLPHGCDVALNAFFHCSCLKDPVVDASSASFVSTLR